VSDIRGAGAADLGSMSTEAVRPELDVLDSLEAAELVALITADARRAIAAVGEAAPSITAAVELVCQRLSEGGRLIYVGAGTAGRLAVLDAAELGPTFGVPDGIVEAVLAGGDEALRHAAEGAEDDGPAGAAAMKRLGLSELDVVVGISASGRTPFVLAAVKQARSSGAATIGVSCNAKSPLSATAEHAVELVVGGEVVAGSSRMNAGTAQKIALNTISTATMVLMGKTYGNLMVDLRPTNAKLRDRAVRIVGAIAGVDPQRAAQALEVAGWNTKLACLVASSGKSVDVVAPALEASHGRLREALALVEGSVDSEGQSRAPSGPTLGAVPGRLRSQGTWKRLGVGVAFVDGVLVPGDVAIDADRVVAVGLPGNGSGIAAPGLVDLQVNGYAGVDAARASSEELVAMGIALARDGVLAYQPTLISDDPTLTRLAVSRIAEVARRAGGSGGGILGVHLEGPFLSPDRAGVHRPERLRAPDRDLLETLLAAGPVTMVTLAPELPGALPLIAFLTRRGTVVSLGHSAATAKQAAEAVDSGASVVTHLYNAMPPMSARAPGLAGLALADRRLRLQLIADGTHVADELIQLAFAAAPERCSIVTDATSLAGRGDGELTLAEVPIHGSQGVARRGDGTIAGGAATLAHGLRHLVSLSVSLSDALAAVTERPARVLGRRDVGHLREGGQANVVMFDDHLEPREVLVNGRSISSS